MSKKSINVDGVDFSKEHVQSFGSEADFLEAMQEKTYQHLFEGPKREEKLKEVYKAGQPASAPAADAGTGKGKK